MSPNDIFSTAFTSMRASRLLSIQMLLEMRGRMTARELAEELEVSLRTLHRDVDQLTAAGVPIYAERGRAGGFRMLAGWKPTLDGLTPAEAEVVLLGGLAGPAADLGLGDRLESARMKILAAMPAAWRADALRISSRLHIDSDDWYGENDGTQHLAVIAAAVWGERQLRMRYRSWKETSERTVSPIALVLKAGHWYFVADGPLGLRTYRIASVHQVTLLDAVVERSPNFDLPTYWKESVRRLEIDLYRRRASIRANAKGLRNLCALGRVFAQAVARVEIPASLSATVELTIPLESGDFAIGQLAHLAPDVEVLRPHSVRKAIAKRLEAAWRPYCPSREIKDL
ncbi:MAG: helix-turn-helix transcriptional regulator [Thiomonas delicata]|jgi:predicted DNA-binding transcriptional regulator YafY|nr:YafY family protein [Thiomonas sp.]